MARRPVWSGSISFGLVSIPVRLYSATEDHTVHFNQFQRGTSDRIRYRRVNERTGEEVDHDDVVKGHEVGEGEYVLVEQQELDEIAPGRSRTLDIDAFVDLDEIDPIHFRKTYWLAPARPEHQRAYSLLAQAMERTDRVGIATFVVRGKQYLTAVRADDGVLALETLFFADEIRAPADVLDEAPSSTSVRGRELTMATSLVESMVEPWRPEKYRDTYTERVRQLVRDKREGREVVTEAEPPAATDVVDLVEALRRSVESVRGAGGKKAAGKKGEKQAKKKRSPSSPGKAELERRARELGVPGRSTMSRAELEKAVAKAGRKAGAKADRHRKKAS